MQSKHHTKECEITRSIGLDEAQCNLGLVVEEAFYGRNTFVVTHSDCEMAAIVSIEEYRKWQQLAKQTALQMVRNVWEVNKDVPEVELEADVEKAMEMLRSDNMAQASIALRL